MKEKWTEWILGSYESEIVGIKLIPVLKLKFIDLINILNVFRVINFLYNTFIFPRFNRGQIRSYYICSKFSRKKLGMMKFL